MKVGLKNLSSQVLFGTTMGLGLVGFILFLLGSATLLSTISIILVQLALSLIGSWDISRILIELRYKLPAALRTDRPRFHQIVLVFIAFISLTALLNSLTPPWDYDGLMYHLTGPKIFLERGGLFPYPENWYMNGPFSVELIFTLGMGVGDDVFPKLVHFFTGVLLVYGTWYFARKWFNGTAGWIAAGTLLTIPTLPAWATFAYIDLAWGLFEFLSLTTFFLWIKERRRSWLILSGCMTGFAMASKYLGLMALAVIATVFLYLILRGSVREFIKPIMTFSLPVLAFGAPWYLRNALWFGNPFYPLYFGGPGVDPTALEMLSAYIDSFGFGRTIVDYLALPVRIYTANYRFSAVMSRIDIPSILFPLLIGLPFTRDWRGFKGLFLISLLRGMFWSIGSQQSRFLLPIYPILSIGVAIILRAGFHQMGVSGIMKRFALTLIIGLMCITGYYQVLNLWRSRALSVLGGQITRTTFLMDKINVFAAKSKGVSYLEADHMLVLFGDIRSYYCYPRCLVDTYHYQWAAEISDLPTTEELESWFSSKNASHLLLSWEELNFLLLHDPHKVLERALRRIVEWRDRNCLQVEYSDQYAEVYAVTCHNQKAERVGQKSEYPSRVGSQQQ